MKIIIVAATPQELAHVKMNGEVDVHDISYAVHGVGLIPAVFHLQQIAQAAPDLIIQCGLAGTYSNELFIGQTVLVNREYTDAGAEDNHTLLSVFDLGFSDPNEYPFLQGSLPCPYLHTIFPFPFVDALSVNSTAGCKETISKRKQKFPTVSIESMEGAALHYTGLMYKIPFLQLRTISNLIEPRNKENWNIALALENNAAGVKTLLQQLDSKSALKNQTAS